MSTVRENPWLQKPFLAYAHQGGAWEAPSSTLYAIRRAITLGVGGIELDVHATADRQLVVCHDPSVDRTTNASGAIATLTLAELRALDNAYWWIPGADVTPGRAGADYPFRGKAPEDPSFGIPTLVEVLELLADVPDVAVNLDIKRSAPSVSPYETLLADILRDWGSTERVIVASFLDGATDAFSRAAPEIATSAGISATAHFLRAVRAGEDPPRMRHVALQVPTLYQGVEVLDEQFVEVAHAQGLAVHVWTINDPGDMARVLDLGVDGIITDTPTPLLSLLKSRTLV